MTTAQQEFKSPQTCWISFTSLSNVNHDHVYVLQHNNRSTKLSSFLHNQQHEQQQRQSFSDLRIPLVCTLRNLCDTHVFLLHAFHAGRPSHTSRFTISHDNITTCTSSTLTSEDNLHILRFSVSDDEPSEILKDGPVLSIADEKRIEQEEDDDNDNDNHVEPISHIHMKMNMLLLSASNLPNFKPLSLPPPPPDLSFSSVSDDGVTDHDFTSRATATASPSKKPNATPTCGRRVSFCDRVQRIPTTESLQRQADIAARERAELSHVIGDLYARINVLRSELQTLKHISSSSSSAMKRHRENVVGDEVDEDDEDDDHLDIDEEIDDEVEDVDDAEEADIVDEHDDDLIVPTSPCSIRSATPRSDSNASSINESESANNNIITTDKSKSATATKTTVVTSRQLGRGRRRPRTRRTRKRRPCLTTSSLPVTAVVIDGDNIINSNTKSLSSSSTSAADCETSTNANVDVLEKSLNFFKTRGVSRVHAMVSVSTRQQVCNVIKDENVCRALIECPVASRGGFIKSYAKQFHAHVVSNSMDLDSEDEDEDEDEDDDEDRECSSVSISRKGGNKVIRFVVVDGEFLPDCTGLRFLKQNKQKDSEWECIQHGKEGNDNGDEDGREIAQ